MRLIMLKWYLRDMTNAILDQAVHVDGMTRDEAMKLLVEDAFQEEREAAGKWKRAQLTSAQLSTYFVGYLEHADLRREAEAAWGDEFDLKAYHDKVLSFGSPPVQFVGRCCWTKIFLRADRETLACFGPVCDVCAIALMTGDQSQPHAPRRMAGLR